VLTVPSAPPVPRLRRREWREIAVLLRVAIDNTTRKLVAAGRRPVSVRFWVALGHSPVQANGGQTSPGAIRGRVRISPDTAPDLRLFTVGLTGFEPATP
jgi:hypothetical protein